MEEGFSWSQLSMAGHWGKTIPFTLLFPTRAEKQRKKIKHPQVDAPRSSTTLIISLQISNFQPLQKLYLFSVHTPPPNEWLLMWLLQCPRVTDCAFILIGNSTWQRLNTQTDPYALFSHVSYYNINSTGATLNHRQPWAAHALSQLIFLPRPEVPELPELTLRRKDYRELPRWCFSCCWRQWRRHKGDYAVGSRVIQKSL